jgi:hypothetical protein
VVLDGADATAVRNTDGERHGDAALVAVAELRDLGDDLVEGGVDEAVELDLADGSVTAQGEPDGGADDTGLGERRIDDPAVAEVGLESLGDAEHAAELADVLPHEDDLGIVVQGTAEPRVERLAERHGRGAGARRGVVGDGRGGGRDGHHERSSYSARYAR